MIVNSSLSTQFQLDGEIEALYENLNEYMLRNRRHIAEDMQHFELSAEKSGLLYAEKPLAVRFYPLILSETQLAQISQVVTGLSRLMEKITQLFLQESSIRHIFGFGPEQTELIEVDPGYRLAIPCGRFDSFFDGQTIRFTEFNTDGTAGMDGAEKIAKLFLAVPSMSDFFSGRRLTTFEITGCVLQTLLECYYQFIGAKPLETPRIAIVDWKEARTRAEFAAFADFCRAQGYEAVVADPRELEYDGNVLSHRGAKIDIIYRRVVSGEYMEHLEEVKPMTRAYKDNNVCVVGSFRSDVAFSKRAFALMHSPESAHFFSEQERELISRHIPWTQPFEHTDCEYRGTKVSMTDFARNNKDSLVLKPSNLYEGRGVWMGKQKEADEWEELMDTALEQNYVLQELIPIPSMDIVDVDEGFEIRNQFVHLGEYVFGGAFCGLYCRLADGPLIGMISRERLTPCFVLRG